MTAADILMILMGISSGLALLLTFSCCRLYIKVKIYVVVITGLKKKDLLLFAIDRFVEFELVADGLSILAAIFCPISENESFNRFAILMWSVTFMPASSSTVIQ